jgi:hypothetical protein
MRPNYVYDDLSQHKHQIRLVRFQQNADDGVIGDMRTFDLDSTPIYKALSYTWGSPSPLRPIVLNDNHFEIRHNLFLFLLKFAAPVSEEKLAETSWSPWIWIDQLSINQSSITERNSQVQFMDTIYRTAEEVIVWLGPDPHRGRAFALFNELNSIEGRLPTWLELSENDRKVWLDFLGNGYWKRLWVVQEIILAQRFTLHYGDAALPDDTFTNICNSAMGMVNTTTVVKFFVNNRGGRQTDMFWALNSTTTSLCEDPRDKIYGLQSLFAEENRVAIDYGKSVEEVYIDVACRLATVRSELEGLEADVEGLYYIGRGMGLLRRVALEAFAKVLAKSDEEFYAIQGGAGHFVLQAASSGQERLTSRLRYCLQLDE